MIMDIFVDRIGHFSFLYDMDRNAEWLLFITDMNESRGEWEFVPVEIC